MSQVVSCDPEALATICSRLRQVAEQVDSHPTHTGPGAAFAGAAPGTAESFDELCSDTHASRSEVADQVRALAATIENAARTFERVERSLETSLSGHVT